ncbi:chorismate mutase [Streptomyces sp. A5-4]|uniref:chorismate mutase n=1 Tax=Streptomyces sp. A5-4 TaxID=3384771 RepID=UPI003DA9ED87
MTGTTGTQRVADGSARIEELRGSIDVLDRQIVRLLAERTAVVLELTEHKRDEETVRSPRRVEQVISKVRRLAEEEGMPPAIAEATYRTLIAELTDLQMRRLAERRAASEPVSASASAAASASAGAEG